MLKSKYKRYQISWAKKQCEIPISWDGLQCIRRPRTKHYKVKQLSPKVCYELSKSAQLKAQKFLYKISDKSYKCIRIQSSQETHSISLQLEWWTARVKGKVKPNYKYIRNQNIRRVRKHTRVFTSWGSKFYQGIQAYWCRISSFSWPACAPRT